MRDRQVYLLGLMRARARLFGGQHRARHLTLAHTGFHRGVQGKVKTGKFNGNRKKNTKVFIRISIQGIATIDLKSGALVSKNPVHRITAWYPDPSSKELFGIIVKGEVGFAGRIYRCCGVCTAATLCVLVTHFAALCIRAGRVARPVSTTAWCSNHSRPSQLWPR